MLREKQEKKTANNEENVFNRVLYLKIVCFNSQRIYQIKSFIHKRKREFFLLSIDDYIRIIRTNSVSVPG